MKTQQTTFVIYRLLTSSLNTTTLYGLEDLKPFIECNVSLGVHLLTEGPKGKKNYLISIIPVKRMPSLFFPFRAEHLRDLRQSFNSGDLVYVEELNNNLLFVCSSSFSVLSPLRSVYVTSFLLYWFSERPSKFTSSLNMEISGRRSFYDLDIVCYFNILNAFTNRSEAAKATDDSIKNSK